MASLFSGVDFTKLLEVASAAVPPQYKPAVDIGLPILMQILNNAFTSTPVSTLPVPATVSTTPAVSTSGGVDYSPELRRIATAFEGIEAAQKKLAGII